MFRMRSVVGFCLAALCLAAITLAKVETEDGVLVVTKDNFESVIQDNEYVLLEFCEYTFPLSSSFSREARHSARVSVAFPRSCTLCTFCPRVTRRRPRTEAWERRDADPRRELDSSRTRSPRHRAPARSLAGSARCEASRYTSSLEHPRGQR